MPTWGLPLSGSVVLAHVVGSLRGIVVCDSRRGNLCGRSEEGLGVRFLVKVRGWLRLCLRRDEPTETIIERCYFNWQIFTCRVVAAMSLPDGLSIVSLGPFPAPPGVVIFLALQSCSAVARLGMGVRTFRKKPPRFGGSPTAICRWDALAERGMGA